MPCEAWLQGCRGVDARAEVVDAIVDCFELE